MVWPRRAYLYCIIGTRYLSLSSVLPQYLVEHVQSVSPRELEQRTSSAQTLRSPKTPSELSTRLRSASECLWHLSVCTDKPFVCLKEQGHVGKQNRLAPALGSIRHIKSFPIASFLPDNPLCRLPCAEVTSTYVVHSRFGLGTAFFGNYSSSSSSIHYSLLWRERSHHWKFTANKTMTRLTPPYDLDCQKHSRPLRCRSNALADLVSKFEFLDARSAVDAPAPSRPLRLPQPSPSLLKAVTSGSSTQNRPSVVTDDNTEPTHSQHDSNVRGSAVAERRKLFEASQGSTASHIALLPERTSITNSGDMAESESTSDDILTTHGRTSPIAQSPSDPSHQRGSSPVIEPATHIIPVHDQEYHLNPSHSNLFERDKESLAAQACGLSTSKYDSIAHSSLIPMPITTREAATSLDHGFNIEEAPKLLQTCLQDSSTSDRMQAKGCEDVFKSPKISDVGNLVRESSQADTPQNQQPAAAMMQPCALGLSQEQGMPMHLGQSTLATSALVKRTERGGEPRLSF